MLKKVSMQGKLLPGFSGVFALMAIVFIGCAGHVNAQENILNSFGANSLDGQHSYASLVFDTAGNLYGTTKYGGVYANGFDGGTVFELTPVSGGGWSETVLYSFGNGTDGNNPAAGLIFDSAGNLYGTTVGGGAYGGGTVFELTPYVGGGWSETILYSFGNGTDGVNPYASLIFDAAGNLYGTTALGGIYGTVNSGGTVFELIRQSNGAWTEQRLHDFGSKYDGSLPYAGLVFDPSGNLYGTTFRGSGYGAGTVFELIPQSDGSWAEKRLHGFGHAEDGANPASGVIVDAAGRLYGTTVNGGGHHSGIAYQLTQQAAGNWTELRYSFGSNSLLDGAAPNGLVFDKNGNLYGTTFNGGANGANLTQSGTVFKFSHSSGGSWTESILHSFGSGNDGAGPGAALVVDASGNLYGTTVNGGMNAAGVVFQIEP